MTVPSKKEAQLISQIDASWRAPTQTDADRVRFEYQLNQALSSTTHTHATYKRTLAFALFTVALGCAVAQWHHSSLEGPSTITPMNDESWVALWAEEDTSLDDEALPDDYMLLSRLID